ncbi:hypothetical protein DFR67_11969 [Williamsia limnetica]|uniref:Uncharacterized protein n=1 Tax=Williamsia limnetica TaxID=882452 RepID=A0A318RC95_WILLI|nr:hypothetical protein DFR67_11969 [Williamsia limnetica]
MISGRIIDDSNGARGRVMFTQPARSELIVGVDHVHRGFFR